MKRAPSEDLFRLIKSLSKGEKRNFKLLAGLLASDKDKRYIELFDVIDKQEAYDEGKVLRQIKDLYGGQLAVGKHYLYRLILKSLVYYRSNPSADLNNLIEQVNVLLEKDLYSQAQKLLRKGIAEAAMIEDFARHSQLLDIQLTVLLRMPNDKRMAENIAEIEMAIQDVMAKWSNLNAYKSLSNKVFLLLQTRQVVNGAFDRAALHTLKSDPLLEDISLALTSRAQIEYLALQRKLASFEGDLVQAAAFSEQLLQSFDAHILLKEEMVRDYCSELANLCTYYLRMEHWQLAFSKMEEFRLFRSTFPKCRVDFYQLYYVMVIASAVHVGQPERAIALEAEIEVEWNYLEGKVPKAHEMWLRYLMAYANFMQAKPAAALKWLNRMFKEPRTELRVDIQTNARILNLLVHFELGNYQLVESELLSTKRFLDKHNQYFEYEKQCLRCIKALTFNASSVDNQKGIIENWLPRLEQLDIKSTENSAKMLDMIDWLQSLLTKKNMATLRREKVKAVDFSFIN